MVALLTLDQSVRVQILLPQPKTKPWRNQASGVLFFMFVIRNTALRIDSTILKTIFHTGKDFTMLHQLFLPKECEFGCGLD